MKNLKELDFVLSGKSRHRFGAGGDGQADGAVYRNGTWYLLQSANGFAAVQFGLTSDKPVPSAYAP